MKRGASECLLTLKSLRVFSNYILNQRFESEKKCLRHNRRNIRKKNGEEETIKTNLTFENDRNRWKNKSKDQH